MGEVGVEVKGYFNKRSVGRTQQFGVMNKLQDETEVVKGDIVETLVARKLRSSRVV